VDGGSNGAIFDSNKLKMAAAAILDNFEWPYLRNGSRSLYRALRGRLCDSIAFLLNMLALNVTVLDFSDILSGLLPRPTQIGSANVRVDRTVK